jgi:nicotinamidase-related amidase
VSIKNSIVLKKKEKGFQMKKLPQNCVLLIIDVQKGFDEPVWGLRNNPQAEANIVRLLNAWRETQRPVFHVQHLSLSSTSPLRPSQPGCELKEPVKPLKGELLFQKHVNSAFIGTDLELKLRELGFSHLVIVGLTTGHCVSTTVRMAGNLGFTTFVVADACAAFEIVAHDGRKIVADEVHSVSLATLNGEFAAIVETETLLSAL